MPDDWTSEETDNPLYADTRNFYKVEKWTRDGMKVDSLLYAGNNLSKAQEIFANTIKRLATYPADNPAADARFAAVATTRPTLACLVRQSAGLECAAAFPIDFLSYKFPKKGAKLSRMNALCPAGLLESPDQHAQKVTLRRHCPKVFGRWPTLPAAVDFHLIKPHPKPRAPA